MRAKIKRVLSVTLGWATLVASFAVLSIVTSQRDAGAAVATGFVMETYATGVGPVTDLEWAPNGTLFAADKFGVVRVVNNGAVESTFVDISAEVNSASDRGLLGVAVHPDLLNGSPYVYLLYTYDPPETAGNIGPGGPDGTGQRVSRVTRYTANAATNFRTAVPNSAVTILGGAGNWVTAGSPTSEDTANHPDWACGNRIFIDDCIPADGRSHTIGTIAFGPDGMLYVSNGDSSRFGVATDRSFRAQDLDSLAGKIMRIDPLTGQGLADNPFWDGNPDSNRSRVYQYGVRNPFRFAIHPTGEIWIGDVGEGSWDEVNTGPPGSDFGWPCYEGGAAGTSAPEPRFDNFTDCTNYYASNNAVPPTYSYANVNGAAIMASDFVIGTQWPAEYDGALLVGDADQDFIRAVQVRSTNVTEVTLATAVLSVDNTFGPDGELYLASIGTGSVERIRFVGAGQNTAPVANAGADITVVDGDGSGDELISLDGSGSSDAEGPIASYDWSVGGTSIASGVTAQLTLPVGTTVVTLTVTDQDGATASDALTVTINDQAPPPNQPPIADAGADITVEDTDGSGGETVTLDGSGSSDPDGVIVSHEWLLNGQVIATGATAQVTVGIGSTTFELRVTDGLGATGTDPVVVTVTEAPPPPPPPPPGGDLTVNRAELKGGSRIRVEGSGAVGGATIFVDGQNIGTAQANGNFRVESRNFDVTGCTVTVTDGVSTATADLDGC